MCWKSTPGLLLLLVVAAAIAYGQPSPAAGLVQEIRDPNLHARWMLLRDTANPGGPGRLIEVQDQGRSSQRPVGALPVIRAGNYIRIDEHTTVVDASLAGMALETAAPGETLRVRLAIGGRVVRTLALAPGRAALAASPQPEAWR